MTVPDSVNGPVSSPNPPPPAATGRVEVKAPSSGARDTGPRTDAREGPANGPVLAMESRDRFTASVAPVRNALYDVTRVRRGNHQIESSDIMTKTTFRGERIVRKMADIPLATGRNLLHIYQKDDTT